MSSGAVNLAWDNPGNPTIDRYEYRQATTVTNGEYDFSSWRPISPSRADTVTARITGLTNGTRYHFQIRAVNLQSETEVRESGESNTVPATPIPTPSAPRNLKAETRSRLATLTWADPNDSSIQKYQVRRADSYDTGGNPIWPVKSDDEPVWTDIPGSDASTATHTLYDLSIGTKYTFELRGVYADNHGAWSRVTVTPARRGAVAAARSTLTGDTKCFGYADGAGSRR